MAKSRVKVSVESFEDCQFSQENPSSASAARTGEVFPFADFQAFLTIIPLVVIAGVPLVYP
jgi:hypothetical protein